LKLIVGDLVHDPQHNLFIFIDENNLQNHTIYDIVLPLPRHDTVYPANEIAIWYNDLFQEDGISKEDFNLSSKYNLSLCYLYISFYTILIISELMA
jgi:hypothetical protein